MTSQTVIVPRTAPQALTAGYRINRDCYPWIAYKGPASKPDSAIEIETECETELREAAMAGAATINAFYQFLDRIEKSGGAASISGIAACNTMLKSMKKNRNRVIKLVIEPIQKAAGVRL